MPLCCHSLNISAEIGALVGLLLTNRVARFVHVVRPKRGWTSLLSITMFYNYNVLQLFNSFIILLMKCSDIIHSNNDITYCDARFHILRTMYFSVTK